MIILGSVEQVVNKVHTIKRRGHQHVSICLIKNRTRED